MTVPRDTDIPIGSVKDETEGFRYRIPILGEPSEGDTISYSSVDEAFVPAPALQTNSFTITDDAGDGSVEGDCNATDFTGQDPVIGQAANLVQGSVNTFVHKTVAYNWAGPTGVTVGVGGSYVAVAGDFAAIGTADHALLTNLTAADQHPTSAITGLDAEQTTQDGRLTTLESRADTTDSEQGVQDGLIAQNATDITSNDGDITALQGRVTVNEGEIDDIEQWQVDHVTPAIVADPHAQYALETAVLANFVAAGYGGIGLDAVTALADVGVAWITLDMDVDLIAAPRAVTQNPGNGTLAFASEGIWQIYVKVTLSHNDVNDGRQIRLRLINVTTATPSPTEFVFFVGRNQGGTNMSFLINVELAPVGVGDEFAVQVSSIADSFNNVAQLGSIYQANHISEYKGVL